MAANTTRVVFALDYHTADGRLHKGGTEVAVDADEARDLLHRGIVQVAKESDLPPTQLDAPAVKADSKGGK